MKDICLPVPDFAENEDAFITVKVGGKEYLYTITAFNWETNLSGFSRANSVEKNISHLKKEIESKEYNWELLQILTPSKDAKYIRVLFRKRQ
ncbi:MAG: hypothetical protein JXB49_20985 [Bacteroidales bacterium]|nr:hypothetical protein [Bacteroidales bacterium]